MMPATVDRMETDGTLAQELAAWRATTHPVAYTEATRCPWPRCCHLSDGLAELLDHLDRHHGGCAP